MSTIKDGSGAGLSAAVALSRMKLGLAVALTYSGVPRAHEAILVCRASDPAGTTAGMTWHILTPDDEEKVETLDGSGPDASGVYILDAMGNAPNELRGHFYRFRDYPDDDRLVEAYRNAVRERGGWLHGAPDGEVREPAGRRCAV